MMTLSLPGASRECRRTLLALAVLGIGCAAAARAQAAPNPLALARVWDTEHVDLPVPPLVTHREVETRLRAVRDATPDLFSLEEIGRSVEGRALYHMAFGRGPVTVLLWSQMHGDEPTATSALFDLFEYVRRHRTDPAVARMLDALTIHAVPMLNPDGAERFQRRNAQGIDINRDALLLQTPEGRALKALRDRLSADVGFNLHNQSWRTSVGRSPRPASISLLSVAYDEARTENDGRRLTKRLCAVIRDALEPLAPGQIGRYDDEFEVRAFGDNVTLWGTPVVLIETGPWTYAAPDRPLVRLNFVAIVSALDALATGRVRTADPARYESLPVNESRLFAMRISHATIVAGSGAAPFVGDVGVGVARTVRQGNGRREIALSGRIEDLGDLRTSAAIEEVDATGLTLVPDVLPSARVGNTVILPDWSAAPARATIAIGQPARFLLLRPGRSHGTYLVERVLNFDDRWVVAVIRVERVQSLGEEIANGVTHGVGALASIVALPVLVMAAVPHGVETVVGNVVFGVSLFLLYCSSTIYHSLARNRAKRVFRILDHSAIYLLIAGTYTPFTLGVLRGPWGWTLFGLVWGLAALGVAVTASLGVRFPRASVGVYIGMGWLIVVAAKPLLTHLSPAGLAWLAAGGLAYTGGTAFYGWRRIRYQHAIWHLFVLTGSACHFIAVLLYAAPPLA